MPPETRNPPAVQRYLEQLELELKQIPGVVPEEALADAREFLHAEFETLGGERSGLGDDELLERFRQRFGEPANVAAAWGEAAGPVAQRPGVAPGWRICCTRCGRSAPAARVGITRIGARSKHKYIVGWCSQCGWFRWLRLTRDLDRPVLTEQLGLEQTPEELRRSQHRPWMTLALCIAAPFVVMAILWAIVAAWRWLR